MKSHEDLTVYQKALDLVMLVYKISQDFPAEEKYGLVSQIRRSAVSIPSNIAEGAARNTKKDFIRFLHISLGSLAELETQLEISHRFGFLEENENLKKNTIHIRRMLLKLIKSLE